MRECQWRSVSVEPLSTRVDPGHGIHLVDHKLELLTGFDGHWRHRNSSSMSNTTRRRGSVYFPYLRCAGTGELNRT